MHQRRLYFLHSYRSRHRVPQVLKVMGWALGAWLLVGGLFWAVRALL